MKPKTAEIRTTLVVAHIVMGMVAGTMTGVADLGRISGPLEAVVGTGWWPIFPVQLWLTRRSTWPTLMVYLGVLTMGWMGAEVVVFVTGNRATAAWEWCALAFALFVGALMTGTGIKFCRSVES